MSVLTTHICAVLCSVGGLTSVQIFFQKRASGKLLHSMYLCIKGWWNDQGVNVFQHLIDLFFSSITLTDLNRVSPSKDPLYYTSKASSLSTCSVQAKRVEMRSYSQVTRVFRGLCIHLLYS